MTLRKALLLVATIPTLALTSVRASHISGGEILYESLGGGQYLVTVNLFRDCAGITMPTTIPVDFASPCGNLNFSLPLLTSNEVSQLCPGDLPNSSCNGGTLPGMEMYTYQAIVTLAPDCDSWTMSWSTCCRNDAITNLVGPGTLDTYLEATVNTEDYPDDSSPVFNNVPIPYVCLNQPVNYSFGVSEPDGDSLNYTLIAAMEAGGTPVPYAAPYSATDPITGITLDLFTGLMQFTPTTTGNFVVTVLVTQYDEDGNVIGTVMRDIQFVVIPCTNQAPDPLTGGITNFSGAATQTGPYAIEMCETDDFCFDFTIDDPDAANTLTLSSNLAIALPGSTFTWSGTNPVSGTVCWTAPVGSGGFHTFVITALDDACPVNSFQTYVYTVNVLDRTSAGPDITICNTQVAQLDGNGGSIFNWSVMSTTPPGDPIAVGVNFSCNPCEDPIADPAVTTTYIVTSDLAGTCINSDTVTVFVVPGFTFEATQSATTACLGEDIQFNVTVTPPGAGYTYDWSPATGLSATNISNPVGSYNVPGTFGYTITMTSPDNCTQLDTSIQVTVNPAFAPDFTLIPLDTFICEGQSANLLVALDNTVPNFCGLNFAGCSSGIITELTTGPDSLFGTATSYPAIYGNFYTGTRNQFIFRASELQAMGFVGGTISEMAFNIQSIPGGAATVYYDFEIKMGCTIEDSVVMNQWIGGLSVVYPADTITITPGWNNYVFQAGFNWDGVSNLVIEVCTDNFAYLGGGAWTDNSPNYYVPTTWPSVHQWHSDQGQICTDTPTGFAIESVQVERPVCKFNYCAGVNEDQLSFSWTPSSGLSCTDCPNPTATPGTSPITYTVQVSDALYGCYNEASVTVTWYPPADISFEADPEVGVAPVPIFFNNTSNNAGNFSWTFGDGSTATDFEPTHEYVDPAAPPDYYYVVTLVGYDNTTGCIGVYVDSVQIIDRPIVEIPNVFSPDNDNSNDAFGFIQFKGVADFKMKIFNRWGQLVHESSTVNSKDEVWRPSSDISDGTYYYEFNGMGYNGESVNKTGHVTLLRKK